MHGTTLANLMDCSATDFDSDRSQRLVSELLSQSPNLLRSPNREDFDLLLAAARVVGYAKNPRPIESVIQLLLDVAFATVLRGRANEGLSLVERAIDLSQEFGLRPELRRAYNAYSGLSTDAGFPARGIECGVRANAIAAELGDPVGLAGAQSNIAAALHMLGLYKECVDVCRGVIEKFGDNTAVSDLVAMARVNLASSAIALQNYRLGADTSKDAAHALGLTRDGAGIFIRLVCEVNWLKCAIGLDEKLVATQRLENIRALVEELDTPRTELNRQLAEAAYEIFDGDLTIANARLLKLLETSNAMPTLRRDNLVLLVRAYEKMRDHTNVLIYLGKLVEHISTDRINKIQRLMELLREKIGTPIPGKDDAQAVIAYLRSGKTKKVSPESVPAKDYLDALERLAITAELKEDASGRHMYRVGCLARHLAEALGKDAEYCEAIDHAARLHDIGKLGLPDEVIMNAGKLTPEQRQAMQMHCEIGAQMIDQTGHPALAMAREVAQSHHERWDGSGYPQKLKGEAIPLSARIAAIAEVYDVLTHERSYRLARTHAEALAIMRLEAGAQFDPALVEVFETLITRLYEMHGDDLPEFLAEASHESSFLQAKDEMERLVDSL
jgi:putative two-component system response regulator